MSCSIKDLEWKLANFFFDNQQPLKQNEVSHLSKPNKVSHLSKPNKADVYKPQNQLNHSFIKFDVKTLALSDKIAGKGQFGVVRYSQSQNGTTYAVKVQPHKSYIPTSEITIAKDVGLVIKSGITRRSDSKNNLVKYEYNVMPDLGQTLTQYLKNKKRIHIDDKFDIAIKLCLEVSQHHLGVASALGRPIVHRDIKPDNIMLDNKKGQVKLTDYGFSEYQNPNNLAKKIMGTPYYLPYITKYYPISNFTYEDLDLIALKRCLYMPNKLNLIQGKLINVETDIQRIFSRDDVDNYQLLEYLDTYNDTKSQANNSALFIGSILILASKKLNFYVKNLNYNSPLQKAVQVIYFANKKSPLYYTAVLKSYNKAARLCQLWPLINKIKSQYLNQALDNNSLYQLLEDVAKRPKNKQRSLIYKINNKALSEISNELQINFFRQQLGLSSKININESLKTSKLHTSNKPLNKIIFFDDRQQYYMNKTAIKKPMISQIMSSPQIIKEIRLKISQFSLSYKNQQQVDIRLQALNKNKFISPSLLNEHMALARLTRNLLICKSLIQLKVFIHEKIKYTHNYRDKKFNQQLLQTLKKILLQFNKNDCPDKIQNDLNTLLKWLNKKIRPKQDLQYGTITFQSTQVL